VECLLELNWVECGPAAINGSNRWPFNSLSQMTRGAGGACGVHFHCEASRPKSTQVALVNVANPCTNHPGTPGCAARPRSRCLLICRLFVILGFAVSAIASKVSTVRISSAIWFLMRSYFHCETELIHAQSMDVILLGHKQLSIIHYTYSRSQSIP